MKLARKYLRGSKKQVYGIGRNVFHVDLVKIHSLGEGGNCDISIPSRVILRIGSSIVVENFIFMIK